MNHAFIRPYKIRFSDCDPAGIVFYPEYFVMFNDLLEAWVDSILEGGFAGYIGQAKLGMPIVHLEANFVSVSKMGDEVQLELRVQRLGTKSISLEYCCVGQHGDLRMRVNQTLVTTSLVTHQSIEIPHKLRASIQEFASESNQENINSQGSTA
ncbi:4-hydroxybenzoyl-COA thioesterase [Vibrio nigripulchritudo ATCC 27043]|uniref:acyl-CoA thioesterase n=1 Tax=Vibrio nigripulchritudo TaxID=28173 RepID=UPI00021C31AB|nr:acyl-CoA thioesterase [Vibrio nigripulchritudo]EGU56161.1 4-hydroxybenzoyl-COA thioesterase [Vibrio nigripulchritudo ATCC 27043]